MDNEKPEPDEAVREHDLWIVDHFVNPEPDTVTAEDTCVPEPSTTPDLDKLEEVLVKDEPVRSLFDVFPRAPIYDPEPTTRYRPEVLRIPIPPEGVEIVVRRTA